MFSTILKALNDNEMLLVSLTTTRNYSKRATPKIFRKKKILNHRSLKTTIQLKIGIFSDD